MIVTPRARDSIAIKKNLGLYRIPVTWVFRCFGWRWIAQIRSGGGAYGEGKWGQA
jgi:hypothetical protein